MMRLESGSVPVITEALEFASMGLVPAGAFDKTFREYMVPFADNVPRTLQDICFAPQTSGGY